MCRLLEGTERNDRAEHELYGESSGYSLPEHLATAQKRPEAIAKPKAELQAEARKKAGRKQAEQGEKALRPTGSRKDPKKAKPGARGQRNFTGPASRIMKSSHKAFIPGL